jgi:hypothetical protein
MSVRRLGDAEPFAVSPVRANAVRVEITDADGSVWHGYEGPPLERVAEIAPVSGSARALELDAAATASAARLAKFQTARTVVKTQVARVKAIAPAARTDQDRWLMALSFLIFSEE